MLAAVSVIHDPPHLHCVIVAVTEQFLQSTLAQGNLIWVAFLLGMLYTCMYMSFKLKNVIVHVHNERKTVQPVCVCVSHGPWEARHAHALFAHSVYHTLSGDIDG